MVRQATYYKKSDLEFNQSLILPFSSQWWQPQTVEAATVSFVFDLSSHLPLSTAHVMCDCMETVVYRTYSIGNN